MDTDEIKYYKSLKGKNALEQRLRGRLPIIDIHGHPFIVDMRLGLLRPKDNFMTIGINVGELPINEADKSLSFYYHPATMTQVKN